MSRTIAHRPLTICRRPDLVVHACWIGTRRVWRVKDPVALEYFEFSEQEYAILEMLNGQTTLTDIQRRFEQAFTPQELGLGPLQQFLYRLHAAGLVQSLATGQGDQLLQRKHSQTRQEFLAGLFNILAFRVRGIDPQRWLDRLHVGLPWLFTPWFLSACAVLVCSALALAGLKFDRIRHQLPTLEVFFTPANMIWLAIVLMGAKCLHELAHGLTCRHFGGECHELGLMFLAFTPCLYCNVSDAWMLPSRRERILISSAGVIAEIVLASVCTFLWWFSQPGLLNSICLDVMLICSIGTVAFNANPLLRYDGYFVLSDLWQQSNLAQRSANLWRRTAADWCAGVPWSDNSWRASDQPWTLAAYGLLSLAYRGCLMVLILWLAFSFFKARHLPSVGWAVLILSSAGVLLGPLQKLAAVARGPGLGQWFSRGRMPRLVTALLGAVLLAVWLPVPHWIDSQLVLDAPASDSVYVHVPGRLEFITTETTVRKGDVLARLVNHQLLREIETTRGAHSQAQRQLELLEASRLDDPAAAAQIPAVQEALAGYDQRLAQLLQDEARLTLRAPGDGVLLPPPFRDSSETIRPALSAWTRTPLDDLNLGCWLETGTLLCQVGDLREVAPVLLVQQSEIDLVRIGQPVRMRMHCCPGSVLTGRVAEIAGDALAVLPGKSQSVREIPSHTDATGRRRPVEPTYQARVALDGQDSRLLLRGGGTARVRTTATPLAGRVYRAWKRVFHFHF